MLDFGLLTPFQLTTFVLGIVFSILTIAMVFYTLRHKGQYRSNFVKVLFTFVLPMITFAMWFASVFAAYNLFNSEELYIMLLAIGCGIVLSLITAFVAWVISKCMTKYEAKNKTNSTDVKIEVKVEDGKKVEIKDVETK